VFDLTESEIKIYEDTPAARLVRSKREFPLSLRIEMPSLIARDTIPAAFSIFGAFVDIWVPLREEELSP
jgi:hypothetical protein